MLLEKYRNEMELVKRFLLSIPNINIDSINVYGSLYNSDMFSNAVSDMDVIAMSKEFNYCDKELIRKSIENLGLDFKEKRPVIIKDSLCERIEFYIVLPNINVDITICPPLIKDRNSLEKDSWYDGFEALMGGVYINSYQLYGKIPDIDYFHNNYYPFYDDDLRKKRLDILSNRLYSYNKRIENYLSNGSYELVDHLFKVKKYFIKFLFIYNKRYYWTPEKHIYYQLTKYLELPESEKETLCFLNGNIFECAQNYLDLSYKYLELYDLERSSKKWVK